MVATAMRSSRPWRVCGVTFNSLPLLGSEIPQVTEHRPSSPTRVSRDYVSTGQYWKAGVS
jgi:hypothetical protein